jgi:hypothetical protein
MTRAYDVIVTQHPVGYYTWEIEVLGEVIALGGRHTDLSAIEAFWSATSWAQTHVLLGYRLIRNWWDVITTDPLLF